MYRLQSKSNKRDWAGLRSRTYRNVFWREAASTKLLVANGRWEKEVSPISLPPRVGRDSLDELGHQGGTTDDGVYWRQCCGLVVFRGAGV